MAQITVHDLQNIAVDCTTQFFNNNTPLNESLAKQASDMGLNSDQLQRAVEATNTLTYLKGIEVSKDRTSEFPVADYQEIVKMASLPKSLRNNPVVSGGTTGGVEKQATLNPTDSGKVVAEAESSLAYSFPELTPAEQRVHLTKYAQINSRALERAKDDLEITGLNLVKLAKEIKADPQGLEHLSATSLKDEDFVKVAGLVFGKEVKRLDFVSGMFKSAEISKAQSFVDMYKQAGTLYDEVQYRIKADGQLREGLEKLAFMGAAIKGVSRLLGSASERVATKVGKGIGSAVKGTATGTVKTVGTTVSKATSGIGGAIRNQAQNAFAKTGLGKELKVPTRITPPKVQAKIKGATVLAGAALDAGFYNRTIDPAKDMSGGVWETLQR
jgi:hypothetical protein